MIYLNTMSVPQVHRRFGVRVLHHLNNVSVWWHAVGTFSLVVAILAKAPKHQSAHFVFETFIDGTGGWSERASPAYVSVIGVRLALLYIFHSHANHPVIDSHGPSTSKYE